MTPNLRAQKTEGLMDTFPLRIHETFIDDLWEALQIAGSGIDSISGKLIPNGNTRLAIAGDAFMAAVLVRQWLASRDARGNSPFTYKSLSMMFADLCKSIGILLAKDF